MTLEVAAGRSSPLGLAILDNTTEKGTIVHAAEHLRMVNRALTDVLTGADDCRNLIVTMPPRHGKSFLVSRYAPAWYLSHRPDHQVVLAANESALATTFTRGIRDVVQRRQDVLALEIDPDLRGATEWRCRRLGEERFTGGCKSVGVTGSLTGRSANLLIVDDPVKNAADAFSRSKMEAVWNWWVSVASARLEPDAVAIVVATRWAENDLSGNLLREEGRYEEGGRWRELHFPALDDEGNALWPERFSAEALHERAANAGPYFFGALWQGRPIPPEGGMFDVTKTKIVDKLPSRPVRRVVGIDLAATEAGGDYTAVVLLAQLQDGRFVVEHVARAQKALSIEWACEEVIRSCPMNVPVCMEVVGSGLNPKYMKARLRELLRSHTQNIRTQTAKGSKEIRAQGLGAACERGDLLVLQAPWTDAFLTELEHFPGGVHDDQSDAASGAWNRLTKGAAVVEW
jgi:predicted phage terminase large subunit-like protein